MNGETALEVCDALLKHFKVETPVDGVCAGKFTLWHTLGHNHYALAIAHNSLDDAALNSLASILEGARQAIND